MITIVEFFALIPGKDRQFFFCWNHNRHKIRLCSHFEEGGNLLIPDQHLLAKGIDSEVECEGDGDDLCG